MQKNLFFLTGIHLLLSSAGAAPPPKGMEAVAGGVVSVGGYQKDPPGWGKREVFVTPYFIDKISKPGLQYEECKKRGGEMPREHELEHAIRSNLVTPAPGVEATGSMVNPLDAERLAAAEGLGSYDVNYIHPDGLLLSLAVEPLDPTPHGRCLIREQKDSPAVRKATLTKSTAAKYGRGKSWPDATGFSAFAAGPKGKIKLAKGTVVVIQYQDKDWALVLPENKVANEFADSGVWVPLDVLKAN